MDRNGWTQDENYDWTEYMSTFKHEEMEAAKKK